MQVYRLIQYLARLITWSLLKRGDTDAAARWEGLKNGLAMGRRSEWCRIERISSMTILASSCTTC